MISRVFKKKQSHEMWGGGGLRIHGLIYTLCIFGHFIKLPVPEAFAIKEVFLIFSEET
jgi:hypothetical protein